MSVITDAMIVCTYDRDKEIAQVNKELYNRDTVRHQQFVKMDNSSAGGSKFPSMTVYQACFNHVIDTDIIEDFQSADWKYGNNLLIIDSELTGYFIYDQDGPIYERELCLI